MLKKRIVFLVGPTGIGKSAVAISLAKKMKAEVVSCDSMQVYRQMNILTSKVTPKQQRSVKHHLLSILDPSREYDVAKYRSKVIKVFDQLFAQGKTPLVVGGTGLYYSIIIDGLFPAVPEDKRIRERLNQQLARYGGNYLYQKLAKVDPLAAHKIHPHDLRRIIRALEVYSKTGKPISILQKNRLGLGDEYEIKVFGLNMPRSSLYRRINTRVEKMFKLGLVNEVKKLSRKKLSKTASCAIGIREISSYLKKKCSLADALKTMQQASRNYAKRQLTWFKKDPRVRWINIRPSATPDQVAQIIWRKLS